MYTTRIIFSFALNLLMLRN